MSNRPGVIHFVLLFTTALFLQSAVAQKNYAFIDGQWFDGQTFRPKTLYSVDGILTSTKPARTDSVIDLSGKFIVPPFGEAHNHNIDGFKNVDDRIRTYLADGVFYIKNPNSIPRYTARLAGKINIPLSVDVIFSNGGLTASGGHPLELVQRNLRLGIFTEEDAEGGMYYIIDSLADLNRKWGKIKAGKPDFIKTYLLYSEEFSKRVNDTAYFGWKGLDPAILREIVNAAHRESLRVSAHIESAADFHNALLAGVDEINHMPGFRVDSTLDFSRYEISDEDAREAGRKGVVVVTTLADVSTSNPTYKEKLDRLHRRNLNLLKSNHVRLAVGSDSYRQTSVPEAMYLSGLNVFSNAELLKIWCENTPRAIFPKRRIGRLLDGYEASFLVLGADPIKDFQAVKSIEMRVKQGEILRNQ